METCIACGAETEYNRDVDIKERDGYIEGAGQLCISCYDRYLNIMLVIDE